MDLKAILSRLFNLQADKESSSTTGAVSSRDAIEDVGDEMTGESGFLSYRRRFRIRRGGDSTAIDVFVKMSDRSRQDLGPWKELSDQFCPRECLFYGCLVPMLERTAAQYGLGRLPLPVVHLELVQPTGTLLVMEDLSAAGFNLAPYAMNADEVRCLLGGLAHLQAGFLLTRARLGCAAEQLFGPQSSLADAFGSLTGYSDRYDQFLANGFDLFRQVLPKYLRCEKRVATIQAYLADGFLDKARRVRQGNWAEREATGLTHSDMWNCNFMFLRDQDDRPIECRFLDWQYFGIGPMAFDFGSIWVTSVDNAIVVEEFLPSVGFFHDSIRSLYEAKSQEKFPVSLDQMVKQAIQSLHWGIAGVVMTAEMLWVFKSLENVLANIAVLIEHFKL